MHDETEPTDVIVFDVPDLFHAIDLLSCLADRWVGHAQQEPSAAIVSVLLVPDCGPELASLLRRVETWVAERTLDDVVFWLDGRGYLLRAHGLVGAASAA